MAMREPVRRRTLEPARPGAGEISGPVWETVGSDDAWKGWSVTPCAIQRPIGYAGAIAPARQDSI